MKVLIIKGKHKGKEVEVGLRNFDWFIMKSGEKSIDSNPFIANTLAFTEQGIEEIKNNPKYLLEEFKVIKYETNTEYKYTFKKI